MTKVLALALWTLAWAVSGSVADPVSETSPHRLSFVLDGNVMRIPYYRNLPLSGSYSRVDRAAVLVHGTYRNAAHAYDNLLAAAAITGVVDSTALLVAPQFLTEEDVTFLGLAPDVLFWSEPGWKEGNLSLDTPEHPRPARMSSFAAIDSILYGLATHNPNLHSVVVAGHSAGGQFVQRYAAGNTIEQLLLSQFGIEVSYIVANPSSYLYLNGERVVPGTLDMFEIPPSTSQEACPDYDKYKYGLALRNSYMATVSSNQLIAQYATRYVNYMLGLLDTDPNDPTLDISCAASLQGPYRLVRGVAYTQYLSHFYGSWVQATHRLVLVPGVGHSSTDMFTSTCGAWLLFGGTYCSVVAGTGETEVADSGLRFSNPFRGSTAIRFRVPDGGRRVTLRLYDIRGRTVRTLVEGPQPAGTVSVLWDGRTDTGEPVPSGIYVCRLEQGSQRLSRKITVLH